MTHVVILYEAVFYRSFSFFVGIEPRGNVVLRPAEFVVETVEAGLGEVLVYVEDPEGHTEEVRVKHHLIYSTQNMKSWKRCS